MSSLCRLCLSEGYDTVDLTEYREGLPLSVLAMIILPIKIYEGEDFNLPRQICSSCVQTIISAYQLRDVSLISEKYLKSNADGCDLTIKNELIDPSTIFIESPSFNAEFKPQTARRSRKNQKVKRKCEYCGLKFDSIEELNHHVTEEHFSSQNAAVSEEYSDDLYIAFYKKDKTPKTSMVWKYFGKLYNQDDENIEREFHYCNICLGRKLLTKYKNTSATSTLIFHLNTVHGIGKEGNVVNLNQVRDKYTQRKTRKMIAGPAVEATVCDECGKSFASHHILKKHMKIHSGLFFSCDKCPAKFSYVENMYRHRRCHDPNHLTRYICDCCGNRFAEMKSLRNHITKIHLKIAPQRKFACIYEDCELKFETKFHLKKHLITHTDIKPHVCEFCENAYTSKGDLVKHLQKNHVGNAIYHCETCNESFRFKVELRDHYKVHYETYENVDSLVGAE